MIAVGMVHAILFKYARTIQKLGKQTALAVQESARAITHILEMIAH
jgi:hypothetical protein